MASPDIRTRRRWALPVAAVALVLLSACGQVPVSEPGTLPAPETTAPTATGSPGRPTAGKDAEPVQLNFGELERRSAPVAYWNARDEAIHDDIAGTAVPYPKEPHSLGTLTRGRVPSYAVIPEVDDAQVRMIDAAGTARVLGRGYAGALDLTVSPDRRKVGWRGSDADGTYKLMVAEASSGRVLVEIGLGSGGSVGPFYTDDLLHVISESAGSGDELVVRLSDGKGYDPGAPELTGGAPNVHMMLPIDSPDGGDGECYGVFQLGTLSTAALKPKWQSCEPDAETAVRPDGRYVVVRHYDRGSHTERLSLVELASGRRVLEIRADQFGVRTWSDNGDQLVVEALVGDRLALVTCDVAGDLAGSCGLSTDPMPAKSTSSERYGPVPYVLAGDG